MKDSLYAKLYGKGKKKSREQELKEEILREMCDHKRTGKKGNEAAKHLYESAGFKNIGLRKNFYEKPCEDACVMSRIISK